MGILPKSKSHLPKVWMKCNKISWGKGLRLIGWPFVFRYPMAQITMGENVTINSSFFSNLLGLYQRTIIVARGDGVIEIGNNVGISGTTIYARERIVIGKNTLIGVNCKIMDNDFHPLDVQARNANDFSALIARPVEIGENCFIGCNSILLKGTKLGNNCIVGAGSVVHGEFPDDCTIAGNPAVIIKRGC